MSGDVREPYEKLRMLVHDVEYAPSQVRFLALPISATSARYIAQSKLMAFLDEVSINDLISGLGVEMEIAWEAMDEAQRLQVPLEERLNIHTTQEGL